MNNSYINLVKTKERQIKTRQNYLFGIIIGFTLLIITIFNFLYKNQFNKNALLFSVFLILLATIWPNCDFINNTRLLIVKMFNFLGNCILKLILTLTYIILVIPVGLFMKRNKKEEKKTNFIDYQNSYGRVQPKYRYLKILKLFSSDYLYIIPLIIILIVISIFVFLLTSTVITPFIYTLF